MTRWGQRTMTMHRGRLTILIVGVIALPVTVMLAMATLRYPNPIFIGLTVAFIAAEAGCFYRVAVTPDAWYDGAEERDKRLFAKYPILMGCAVIFVGISVLCDLLKMLGGWLDGWLLN